VFAYACARDIARWKARAVFGYFASQDVVAKYPDIGIPAVGPWHCEMTGTAPSERSAPET